MPYATRLMFSSVVACICLPTPQPAVPSAPAALSHVPPAAAGASTRLGRDRRSLDRSGRAKVGIASFYADRFSGKKMADGTPMRPDGDNAASKTLPLGTTALVTNLKTGKRAIVVIRDRGPYVAGRIVDLSPATARKIGITREQGLARVEVVPLPLRDGRLLAGIASAQDAKYR